MCDVETELWHRQICHSVIALCQIGYYAHMHGVWTVHLFQHADDGQAVAMVDRSIVYNISNKWYPTQADN